jgi:glycosyltransferase involved in cell wall biosynthesis
MLAGVPIIASKNSAIPEVLGERHLGLCVTGSAQDFSNRIIQFQDSAVIERVLKQQADQIIKFDSAEMASQISRLYLRL